jgi:hypothetical protein
MPMLQLYSIFHLNIAWSSIEEEQRPEVIVVLLKAMESENYMFDSEEIRSILKSIGKDENYDILKDLME